MLQRIDQSADQGDLFLAVAVGHKTNDNGNLCYYGPFGPIEVLPSYGRQQPAPMIGQTSNSPFSSLKGTQPILRGGASQPPISTR